MKTINDDYKHAFLAEKAVEREHEVFHYQVNIDNYTAMLETLPKGPWPEDIAVYVGTNQQDVPMAVPPEKIDLVATYMWRDRVAALLVSEKIEQAKAKHVYDTVLAAIPAEKVATLIPAAAADRTAILTAAKAAKLAGK